MIDNLPTLDVVVPVFNEIDCIEALVARLIALRARMAVVVNMSLVLVDDGSSDGSSQALIEIAHRYQFVKVITLSRNFGHQVAVTAGLDHASADYLAIIDADLQDLLSYWKICTTNLLKVLMWFMGKENSARAKVILRK